ncbi:hypothetical protein SUGI_0353220 [Cryptomeria japonica]|nr:hypothetical protein SUGI_0353220 [Cryptomeria japonica]
MTDVVDNSKYHDESFRGHVILPSKSLFLSDRVFSIVLLQCPGRQVGPKNAGMLPDPLSWISLAVLHTLSFDILHSRSLAKVNRVILSSNSKVRKVISHLIAFSIDMPNLVALNCSQVLFYHWNPFIKLPVM